MRGYGSWLPVLLGCWVLLGCLAKCRSGASGNAGKGSHLAKADAAESGTGQTDSPGVSGNAGKGSHLAEADAAESGTGQTDIPGVSGNAGKGSHLAEADTRGTSSGVWNIYRRMEHRGAHGPTSLMHSVQQKAVSEPKLKEVADFCPAK